MRLLLFSLLCATLSFGVPLPELTSYSRAWTSSDGKELNARLLGVQKKKAALELESGKVVKVPFARLSSEDQTFLEKNGWPLQTPWKGWPSDLQVTLASIKIKDKGLTDDWHTYQSDHFEIAAEAQLGSTCVREICRLLEGVYQLMEQSPWGILAKPKNDHFRIELYQTKESYAKNGGPPNSAGVYITSRAVFMVPFGSLGIIKGSSGWRQKRDGTSKTIVHELTHMLMGDALPYLPPWLVEGAAEYMELIPLRTSVFRPSSLDNELRTHNQFMITKIRGGSPAPVSKVFHYNHYEWLAGGVSRNPTPTSSSGGRPTRVSGYTPPGRASPVTGFYHTGLLLTYYFMHLDGEGDGARLQRFIAAAQANSKLLEDYYEEVKTYRQAREDYEKAWDEFAEHPDVTETSAGSYQFPEEMSPPEAPPQPVYPVGDPEDELIRFVDLDVLLEGRDIDAVLKEACEALRKEKIRVSY